MHKILFALLLTLLTALPVFAAEQVFFYHTDPAGTPLSMTNSSGTVVWKADYKPFGEENSITGSAENKRRFVSKEKDSESGLSYFDARYEDSKTGRFVSVDPVGAVNPLNSKANEELLGNPQKLNSYAYGLNNPYRYVDEDGRAVVDKITKILGKVPRVGPYVAKLDDKNAEMARRFNGQMARFSEAIGDAIESLPSQMHHFATNKHSTYTKQMAEIANKYDLRLSGKWNQELMPHLGRHPNLYHDFVLDGMRKAAAEAGPSSARFLQLFDQYVKQPVMTNPNLLRKSGW